MTTTATTSPVPVMSDARPRPVADALTMMWRNLVNIRRNPQLLVLATIQPVIFVLMFRYVFGGAIGGVSGVPYVDFLMPGVFIQTVVFGSLTTGIGLADDLNKGLVERFRSLPMARSAVLIGRTLADLVRNILVVLLMCAIGYLVGWRPHTEALAVIAGIAMVVLFSYSLSWVFAIIGLSVRDAETTQAASFPILALLVFPSTAFVPLHTMPDWLQVYAEHQPVSVVVEAVRDLTIGGPTSSDVLIALAWCVGIVAVFAPMAVARYRKAV